MILKNKRNILQKYRLISKQKTNVMGGGNGHIAKMARENQQKTAQRRERLKKYKKSVNYFYDSKIKLKFKEVSKEKVEEIKQRYLKELEKEKRKNRVILFVSVIIAIPLFYYLVISFMNQIKF